MRHHNLIINDDSHPKFFLSLMNPYTLRPSGTLLFSGLLMMIWQKNLQRIFELDNIKSSWKNSWNQRVMKVTQMIWQNLLLRALSLEGVSRKHLQINLEAKSMHGSSWKKDSIISEFALFFAGQVLFTVNGLNWSQSWQVLICI